MSTIAELALKHECDKSTNGHNYGPFYDKWFGPMQEEVKNILEIGVFIDGRSLCVWDDYFPNATVYGIDIIDPINWDKIKDRKRVKYFRLDGTKQEDLNILIKEVGVPFDIIIDDASHCMNDQQITLKLMLPHLKSKGLFVIEDLHTSYCREFFKKETDVSTQQMLRDYTKLGKFVSPYYTEEDHKMFAENVDECVLEHNKGIYNYHPVRTQPDIAAPAENCSICFIRKK